MLGKGDTFFRLFDDKGVDVARNDDGGCGRYRGSRMYYTVEGTELNPCREFSLVQGCYDKVPCGGSTFVTILGSGHPTSIPSGEPSGQPTSFPTSPTSQPSSEPSGQPTVVPSFAPTILSTGQPTGFPSSSPSIYPSSYQPTQLYPTSQPSEAPKVDQIATILIAVMLPFCTLLAALVVLCTYRYYYKRYYARIHSNKVRCISSINCKNEDILNQINFYEEY